MHSRVLELKTRCTEKRQSTLCGRRQETSLNSLNRAQNTFFFPERVGKPQPNQHHTTNLRDNKEQKLQNCQSVHTSHSSTFLPTLQTDLSPAESKCYREKRNSNRKAKQGIHISNLPAFALAQTFSLLESIAQMLCLICSKTRGILCCANNLAVSFLPQGIYASPPKKNRMTRLITLHSIRPSIDISRASVFLWSAFHKVCFLSLS